MNSADKARLAEREIRAIDPDHIITLEGCWGGQADCKYMGWGLDVLPDPKKFGWTKVVYQMHAYEYDWDNLEKQRHNSEGVIADINAHQGWNVPCLCARASEHELLGQSLNAILVLPSQFTGHIDTRLCFTVGTKKSLLCLLVLSHAFDCS